MAKNAKSRSLYDPQGRYRCNVTHSEGRALERSGLAFRVYETTEDGKRTGTYWFQETYVQPSESRETAATITMSESKANAGESRCYQSILRARRKVRAWPEEFDRKAVRVGPLGIHLPTIVEHLDLDAHSFQPFSVAVPL